MRSPMLNVWLRRLKLKVAKSPVLPTRAPINGVSRSLVKAPTTVANAAPITTPTAMSTTLPRRMNFLKPSSISRHLKFKVADTLMRRRRGGQELANIGAGWSSSGWQVSSFWFQVSEPEDYPTYEQEHLPRRCSLES